MAHDCNSFFFLPDRTNEKKTNLSELPENLFTVINIIIVLFCASSSISHSSSSRLHFALLSLPLSLNISARPFSVSCNSFFLVYFSSSLIFHDSFHLLCLPIRFIHVLYRQKVPCVGLEKPIPSNPLCKKLMKRFFRQPHVDAKTLAE